MLKLTKIICGILVFFAGFSCSQKRYELKKQDENNPVDKKIVVYQVFTRLFGNKDTSNIPWGTKEENGVGKFDDFTDKALIEIKDLGITHIWYTGVLHHALVGDYTKYDISNDDPDVVKGRAGSPYAVKDYYNVNPDLANDPANRLKEFESLIQRTHNHGMKVIIDIVPNHIARRYEGKNNPAGVRDFGADDDKSVEYKRDNNFYSSRIQFLKFRKIKITSLLEVKNIRWQMENLKKFRQNGPETEAGNRNPTSMTGMKQLK
jgi:hypothetical protein